MSIKVKEFVNAKDVRYVLVLCLIAILFLWPAWLRPNSFWYPPGSEFSDLTVTHWPNMWFVRESWREYGQIPLWRPLIMGGAPFVGNPLSAYFYPFNWLFLFLPVTPLFHLLFGLDLIVAGITFYGLMRWGYKVSPFAALIGGLGYMLTPKLIAHIAAGHVGLRQAFSWAPLLLRLLRSAISHKSAIQSAFRAACCGAVLAMVFFADPRVAFYDALLLGCYALYRLVCLWRDKGGIDALEMALRLLLVPLALLLVGGAQILPTLELMTTTTRSALTLQDAGQDSLPWTYLFGYLIADWKGYHEWMVYLGLVPLGAAALALWQGQDRERWFWGGLALVALLFALGTNGPLYPLLFRFFPGLGWVRVPPRALLLLVLAVNVLSAWGIDLFLAWPGGAVRWAMRLAFAGLVLCAALGIGLAVLLRDTMLLSIIAFAVIGTVLMGLWLLGLCRVLPASVLKWGLFALLLIDLGLVRGSLLELRPAKAVLAEGEAVAQYLDQQDGRFRVYSPSYSIRQHVGARYGIEQLDGVDPSQVRWVAQFMALAGGYTIDGYGVTIPFFPDGSDVSTVWQGADIDVLMLGLLNGRFVVAYFPVDAPGLVLRERIGNSFVYENERVMPRAFAMTKTEIVPGWQEAQARLAGGFDPTQSALLEGGNALDGPLGYQEAQITHFSPNRIAIQADVEQAALLVLSEIWYPGWQVTVDGVERPIYRVNGIVRGVALEPGAHTVVWRYRPASLRWGVAISFLALLALVAGGVALAVPAGKNPKGFEQTAGSANR